VTDQDQLARLRFKQVQRIIGETDHARQRTAISHDERQYATSASVAAQISDWMLAAGQLMESAEAESKARELLGQANQARRSKSSRHAAIEKWNTSSKAEFDSILWALSASQDALGYLDPCDLWPELFSKLDAAGLNPTDDGDQYRYGDGEAITYDTFRQRIYRLRKT